MGKGKISDKQTEILEYIKEEQLKKGYPPSVREICKAVDSSLHHQYMLISHLLRRTDI